MSETVLVTGGCGFVGSNLVAKLIDSGYRVRVLDNLSKGRPEYLQGLKHEFVQADIRNLEACDSAFAGINKVIHLAAYGSVVESVDDPLENFAINVQGTLNMLLLAKRHEIGKLIFSSTGGALIGNATPPVNESSLPKPISPYGASKLCCEAYCHAFGRSFDLSAICLRFANVYGPNSGHKTGVINKYFKALREGQPLVIFGDGTSSRDYIHVADLTDGIVLALENENLVNDVIHLATGREVELKELASIVRTVAGKPEHPIIYKDIRKGEVDRNFASFDYAQQRLSFSPNVTLENGLAKLWNSDEPVS